MKQFLTVLLMVLSFSLVASAEDCDPVEYLQRYPDVQAAGMNPWTHWAHYGQFEGRCAPTHQYTCSQDLYFAIRPDVQAAGFSAVDHWYAYGRFEGMCTPYGAR